MNLLSCVSWEMRVDTCSIGPLSSACSRYARVLSLSVQGGGRKGAEAVQIKVSLQLPFIGGIEGTWVPENAERDAAWELYVELVTRVTVVELRPDQGTLREALTSYYQLFGITRDILRRYGPAVARGNGSRITFGRIAVAMLNSVIRPVLAHWHPLLLAIEQSLPEGVDMITHEQSWVEADRLRSDLAKTRVLLIDIARLLGEVAGVESLLPQDFAADQPPPRGAPDT